jgi:chemotaxis protein methyltransferase CheR
MEQRTFDRYRELIYGASGITLGDEKVSLLEGRIRKRMSSLNVSCPDEYFELIEADLSGSELLHLLDAVSTNTTYFYREPEHFTFFTDLVARHAAAGNRRMRIWCAASSSGEEPYTLAIIAAEQHSKIPDLKVLATDISTKVLRRAVTGTYPVEAVERLPPWMRERGFVRNGDLYSVSPFISSHVVFKRLNLVEIPYPLQGPIDVIFCRNVMIYFDIPVRQKIIDQFVRLLAPGGHLFLSHSENLLAVKHPFKRVGSSVFQKVHP